MCRMVALSFSGDGSETAVEILNLLVEASRRDPYLEAIAGDGRHCHGCGYVAALRRGGPWWVAYERMDAEPCLGGEEACSANLEALSSLVGRLSRRIEAGVEEAAVIVHSRRTRGEPRGSVAAHPFREEVLVNTPRGPEVAEIYLSHNGGVNKAVLAEQLGVGDPSLYTDSHLYLKYLARRLEGIRYDEAAQAMAREVSSSKRLAKSALNLCILLNSPSQGPLLVAASHVAVRDDAVRWRYYEPVLVEAQGLAGYVSSTVRDLAERRCLRLRFSGGRDDFLAVLRPGMAEVVEV